jgi:hypothetical protein
MGATERHAQADPKEKAKLERTDLPQVSDSKVNQQSTQRIVQGDTLPAS